MPHWTEITETEDPARALRDRIEGNIGCCLEGWIEEEMLPAKVLVAHADTDEPTDDSRFVLYETTLGTFGVYEDSEDYTGHG